MTGFKAGDHVRTDPSKFGPKSLFHGVGVVEKNMPTKRARYYVNVRMPNGMVGAFKPDELELLAPPRFVNVVDSPTIWVTLPGDNQSHKLTEEQAKQLFRELEEVV